MDDLIVRSLRGELSVREADQLAAWRSLSPGNEAIYQRRAKLWALMAAADRTSQAGPPPQANDVIARAGVRPMWGAPPDRGRRRGGLIAVALALAAVLVLAVVGRALSRGHSSAEPFVPVEFVTAAAEVATARLGDGTVVRLGPETQLRFSNRARGRREVWLKGRAFFAVAKDSTRPFTVHTAVGDAQVLGTRFELKADPTRLRLVVVEGRVALTASSNRVEVGANQVSHAGLSEAPSVMNVDDPSVLLDWVDGLFVFNDTPLSRVVHELERHFHVTISLADSSLAHRTITAWFQEQSFDGVLHSVCRVVAASCTINERGAVIRP